MFGFLMLLVRAAENDQVAESLPDGADGEGQGGGDGARGEDGQGQDLAVAAARARMRKLAGDDKHGYLRYCRVERIRDLVEAVAPPAGCIGDALRLVTCITHLCPSHIHLTHIQHHLTPKDPSNTLYPSNINADLPPSHGFQTNIPAPDGSNPIDDRTMECLGPAPTGLKVCLRMIHHNKNHN